MNLRTAQALADAGRWSDAGDAFLAVVDKALRVRDRRLVREAGQAGADALRRDDRPAAAAKLLRAVLDAEGDPLLTRVQLAATLLDTGAADVARDLVLEAVALPAAPEAHALALDTAVGTTLAAGDVDRARDLLDELDGTGLADVACGFRHAQLDRLDGALGRAEAGFRQVADVLEPHTNAAGPAAAAWSEIGELRLLRRALGDPDADAVAPFRRARDLWARAGRRAGLFRAEAWCLRAEPQPTVPTPVLRAIDYAEQRGLVLLEADLRVALAWLRQDPDEALRAVALTSTTPLARGRARVDAAALGARLDPTAAAAELTADAVYQVRLLQVLGRDDASLRHVAAERAKILLEG